MTNSKQSLRAKAAKELLSRRKARKSLIDFISYTKPDYVVDWIHEVIASELDQFLKDVIEGKSPRLMLFVPPRHGKSEIASRRFPAYAFGKNPNLSIIATSYAASLATSICRDVQKIIDDDKYKRVFESRISSKGIPAAQQVFKRTAEEFEIIDNSGVYKCAGVEGGIIGLGGNILIIDDPVKDFAEANSQTYRDRVFNWYQSTLRTRLAPGGGIIVIQTRWHVDDLSGRLLNDSAGEKWKVIKFPAIAENDEQFRKAGEPLSPKRFNLDELVRIKQSVGSYVWAALYQQNPTILGGGVIRGKWFGRYRACPKILSRKIYADTAMKVAEHNDFSVFECWGKGEDGKLYLLDMIRGKWEAPDLRRIAIDFWNKNKEDKSSPLRELLIEDKASGTGLIQDIKRSADAPVKGIKREKDKLTRVMDVVSYIEAGYVMIPENSPWVDDFLSECEAFTANDSHQHDDQIDPMCDAIMDMLHKKSTGLI